MFEENYIQQPADDPRAYLLYRTPGVAARNSGQIDAILAKGQDLSVELGILGDDLDISKPLREAMLYFFADCGQRILKDKISAFARSMHVYHAGLRAKAKYLPETLSQKELITDDRLALAALEVYVENDDAFDGHQKQIMYAAIEGRAIDHRVFKASKQYQMLISAFSHDAAREVVTANEKDIEEWQSLIYGRPDSENEKEIQEMVFGTEPETMKLNLGVIPITDAARTQVCDNRNIPMIPRPVQTTLEACLVSK